jgi:hypothetical protein
MSFIAEQIEGNAVTKLRFTSADEEVIDDIKQIIDAIRVNSSIVSVDFLDDFLGCVRNDARSELIQALCHIPCLQEVHLEDGLIMVADITSLLCESKRLTGFTLERIVLQGVQEDFDAAEMALHQNSSLKDFSIKESRAAVEEISLDNFVLQH